MRGTPSFEIVKLAVGPRSLLCERRIRPDTTLIFRENREVKEERAEGEAGETGYAASKTREAWTAAATAE